MKDDGTNLLSGSGILICKEGKCRIHTIKHNFKDPNGYSYYFVPNHFLNSETGFLKPVHNKGELKDLLDALSADLSSPVQKIDITKMWSHSPEELDTREFNNRGFKDSVVSCEYIKVHPTEIDNLDISYL